MKKTYLGDSVYLEVVDGMFKLTTNNGYADDPRNVILIELPVYLSMLRVMKDHEREIGC